MLRRFAAAALVMSALLLAVGAGSSLAGSPARGSGPFAEFLACLKAHGAPALGHRGAPPAGQQGSDPDQGKIRRGPLALSPADRAALKQAFTACRDQLPKRTAKRHDDTAKHRFALPTAAQFAAFKTCMSAKGFTLSKPGAAGTRPDLRDPAVRSALKAAVKACLPRLKPAPSG